MTTIHDGDISMCSDELNATKQSFLELEKNDTQPKMETAPAEANEADFSLD